MSLRSLSLWHLLWQPQLTKTLSCVWLGCTFPRTRPFPLPTIDLASSKKILYSVHISSFLNFPSHFLLFFFSAILICPLIFHAFKPSRFSLIQPSAYLSTSFPASLMNAFRSCSTGLLQYPKCIVSSPSSTVSLLACYINFLWMPYKLLKTVA